MPDSLDFHTLDFHTLFCQLQARYPTSSLLTEVAHVQDGHFTVRAIVHISGTPLASSLATAATVEQAEDQARARLLRLLGISLGAQSVMQPAGLAVPMVQPAIQPGFPAAGYETQAQLLADPLDLGPLLAARSTTLAPDAPAGTTHVAAAVPPPASPANTEPEFGEPVSLSFEFDDFEEGEAPPPLKPVYAFGSSATTQRPEPTVTAPVPAPVSAPEPPAATSGTKTRATKGKAAASAALAVEPKAAALPTPEPMGLPVVDMTPVFLQIADEMERIGWSKTQGREHLRTTYSKQTRAELTDDELTDFLAYLKSCPAANTPIMQA